MKRDKQPIAITMVQVHRRLELSLLPVPSALISSSPLHLAAKVGVPGGIDRVEDVALVLWGAVEGGL